MKKVRLRRPLCQTPSHISESSCPMSARLSIAWRRMVSRSSSHWVSRVLLQTAPWPMRSGVGAAGADVQQAVFKGAELIGFDNALVVEDPDGNLIEIQQPS